MENLKIENEKVAKYAKQYSPSLKICAGCCAIAVLGATLLGMSTSVAQDFATSCVTGPALVATGFSVANAVLTKKYYDFVNQKNSAVENGAKKSDKNNVEIEKTKQK